MNIKETDIVSQNPLANAETLIRIEQDKIDQIRKKSFSFKGMPICNKKRITPIKTLIYGYNGVGKSTFASESKNPIFLDLEGNIDHLSVDRQPLSSFLEVEDFIKCLLHQEHEYNTVVIDSIDKLVLLIADHISSIHPKSELTFGKDSVLLIKKIRDVLSYLDDLRLHKKMNVVFIAQSMVKKIDNNPLTQTYDKYELRLGEKIGGIFCDWVHCILFAVNDVFFQEENSKGKKIEKAKNLDKRVLYTVGNTAYVAKNVFNLPPKMEFKWSEFSQNVRKFFEN